MEPEILHISIAERIKQMEKSKKQVIFEHGSNFSQQLQLLSCMEDSLLSINHI